MTGRARWAPVLAVTGLVLAASLVPLGGGSAAIADLTLAGHLVGYAALAWVLARALAAPGRPTGAVLLVAAAGSVLFGAGVELVQPLVGRTGSAVDVGANVAGSGVGALFRAVGGG